MATDVADSTGYTSNSEMSAFGYIVAILIALLLLPLLPVIAVGYVLYRIFASSDDEPRRRSWKRDIGGPGENA